MVCALAQVPALVTEVFLFQRRVVAPVSFAVLAHVLELLCLVFWIDVLGELVFEQLAVSAVRLSCQMCCLSAVAVCMLVRKPRW